MLLNVISTTFVRDDAADKISTLSRFCAGVLFVTILLHFISSLAENNANGDAVDDSNGIENCEQTSTRIHTAGYITNTIYRHPRIITQIYVYRKTDWPTLFYIFAHTHTNTSERARPHKQPPLRNQFENFQWKQKKMARKKEHQNSRTRVSIKHLRGWPFCVFVFVLLLILYVHVAKRPSNEHYSTYFVGALAVFIDSAIYSMQNLQGIA